MYDFNNWRTSHVLYKFGTVVAAACTERYNLTASWVPSDRWSSARLPFFLMKIGIKKIFVKIPTGTARNEIFYYIL